MLTSRSLLIIIIIQPWFLHWITIIRIIISLKLLLVKQTNKQTNISLFANEPVMISKKLLIQAVCNGLVVGRAQVICCCCCSLVKSKNYHLAYCLGNLVSLTPCMDFGWVSRGESFPSQVANVLQCKNANGHGFAIGTAVAINMLIWSQLVIYTPGWPKTQRDFTDNNNNNNNNYSATVSTNDNNTRISF